MGSDLFHTGRMVTGDRLYPAIDIAEMLYEKKLTYCGTINKNRKGLPAKIKTVKSSYVSFVRTENWQKCVAYLYRAWRSWYMSWTSKKSPILPDIYNLQHCGVDIVNEMLKDYSSQPVSNGWTIVVCTFILDLPVINA